MTWVPNEIQGFNLAMVEFLDRLSEPRGWLVKLWEGTLPPDRWDRSTLEGYIGKWYVNEMTCFAKV